MSAIVGPIPAFSNVPIQAEFYEPSRFVIEAIQIGPTTLVTTTVDHDYVIGQQVRLIIPPTCGCRELNEQTGFVISIPMADQVVLDIYSVGFNQFTASTDTQEPQILPIGDINTGPINFGRTNNITFIEGSFINVSP